MFPIPSYFISLSYWRSLQPAAMKDANDNISEILYDALGMPVAMALKGKGSEGDTLTGIDPEDGDDIDDQEAFWTDPQAKAEDLLQGATWRCVYDLSVQPVAVGMITREQHHAVEPESPVQILLTYTDGLGRVIMEKAQCAATTENGNKHWIGSGRTIYNNKGNEVMQYEPYFSATHTCDTVEQAAADGVSVQLHYDPLGRVQRTDYPDGSFERTEWTAWEQVFYDRNDNVVDSDWYETIQQLPVTGIPPEEIADNLAWKDAAAKTLAHNNTPTVQHLDTLARPFFTRRYLEDMDDNDPDKTDSYETLDIEGNRLKVTDGRDKDTLQYLYNMVQSVCWQESLDSGVQRVLVDVAGQPLCGWDADDRQIRFTYDTLRRPEAKDLYLYDAINEEWVLEHGLERMVYGDATGITDAKLHNLRGRLYQIKDGAGVVTTPDYDFKGNPLGSVRQYAVETTQHPNWKHTVALEEDGSSNPVLYTTAISFDALNRPVTRTTPEGGVTSYTYNRTGLLYSGAVADVHGLSEEIVESLVYDAKGQRQKIQYGNGTTTTYAYDPYTFRVTRIRTTRHSDSTELQDLRYWYDRVGNITQQKDKSWNYSSKKQPPYFGDEEVKRPQNKYTYDALYRLIEARGREHEGNNTAPDHEDSGRRGLYPIPVAPSDTAKMRRYTQYYEYDAVGNILEVRHTVTGGTGNWTRYYTIDTDSNRLLESVVGSGTPEEYIYDNRGNLTGTLNHLTGAMSYNAENRLESVQLTATRWAYYQYDSSGQRVRKTIKDSSAVAEMRKYVGDWETYSKYTGSTLDIERESLHVSDDTGRIALIETQTNVEEEELDPLVRYQYSNHLGSATLELDEAGAVISYEEYYPYGSTSFQSGRSLAEVSLKRYRYTGKERDEETGLYYHGARYYIPWLARWGASDPINNEWYNLSKGVPDRNLKRQHVELTASAYEYCYDNPVRFNDLTGEQPPPDKSVDGGVASWFISNDSVIQSSENTGSESINDATAETEISPFIRKLLDSMYDSEGGFVNNPSDPGGATKYGIAEKREWPAAAKLLGLSLDIENIENLTTNQADKYYFETRVGAYRINDVQDEKIANAIFDQSVLTPGIINRNIKRALNDLGFTFKENSARLSNEQIGALNAVDPDTFVERFTSKQLEHYESIKNTNPRNYNTHIDGWKNRLEHLKRYNP